MNLKMVHAILLATTQQPHGFLKIADPKLVPEVQEMAEAGLVTATISDGAHASFTAVNSVTEAGLRFLRVIHPHDFSQPIVTKKSGQQKTLPFVRPGTRVRQ
jgi:hypothetical protein